MYARCVIGYMTPKLATPRAVLNLVLLLNRFPRIGCVLFVVFLKRILNP